MPRYGFNFQWMFSAYGGAKPQTEDLTALDFLVEHGFNFIRIPTDYRMWTRDFDYLHPDESVWERIDGYLEAASQRGIHLSLNLHRAPGYCINGNNLEKHNLWLDEVPQDAFVFLWESFAKRYQGISNERLSFDLVNEPPDVGQYGFTREIHEKLIRRTVTAIRSIDLQREIVIDGLSGGHLAMPELADLGVVHSGRGYQPMPVSHFEAGWWEGSKGLAKPIYPGTVWEGQTWNLDVLRNFYEPWRDVERKGATVHIGEFGCFDHTPQNVAMRWMSDLLTVFKENRWGFALWGFKGSFGIIGHGREGAQFEDMGGYRVDREYLELLKAARVDD